MKKQKENKRECSFALHVEQISFDTQTELFKLHISDDCNARITAMLDGIDPDKLPVIEVIRATTQQVNEYNRSTKQKAIQGFQIKLNDVPAYGIFMFADGSIKQDNLFDLMITAVGNARQSEGMTRAMIDRTQRYAHDAKRNLAAYNHFFGGLTADQSKWMNENTLSYEEELAAHREMLKTRNGGQDHE